MFFVCLLQGEPGLEGEAGAAGPDGAKVKDGRRFPWHHKVMEKVKVRYIEDAIQ